jgi:flavin reductase (DIM6/NTAB) family NADH-FMN oxidoreductase RutF
MWGDGMTVGYLRYLTTTVGLVTTAVDERVNVMTAEWSYFVAREPLHIAVSISEQNWSNSRIRQAGEFAVTLCDDSQAAVAAFAGSFSGLEVDKLSSADLGLAGPAVLHTPHVRGGVLNAECAVRDIVELPGYVLVIGEAVWVQADDDAALHPLIKHGVLHSLGPVVLDDRPVVAAGFPDRGEPVLRVAATDYGAPPGAPWQISVTGTATDTAYADLSCQEDGGVLLVDVALPVDAVTESLTVRVSRAGRRPGFARTTADVVSAVT